MKRMLILAVTIFMSASLVQADEFGHRHGSFEMQRIKARSNREITDRTKIIYEYVDDENLEDYSPYDIGNVRLGRRDRVREVNVGVNLDRPLRFENRKPNQLLEIGNVESSGPSANHLRKVNIHVDIEDEIRF